MRFLSHILRLLLLITCGYAAMAAQEVVVNGVMAANATTVSDENVENNTTGYDGLLPVPRFSHTQGWYTDGFDLELGTDHESAIILYTLDGSDPDFSNLNDQGDEYLVNYFFPGEATQGVNIPRKNKTHIYAGPIPIHNKTNTGNDLSTIITTYMNGPGNYMWRPPEDDVFKGNVVRARLYLDGNVSPVSTATYFVDPLASQRYPIPVVSLVSNMEYFLGYQDGIYVPGQQYFEMGGNPTNYLIDEGNFILRGDEWERPMHIEVFETDGEPGLSQNIGVRIHGNFSRNYPIKGLRLYARNRYDEENMMNYAFIEDATAHHTGMPANEYKRLILHDYHQRDMVAIKLMQQSHAGTQGCSPVALFYNGEFWGVTYTKNRFDRHYVANLYGLDPDNVVMLDAPAGPGYEWNVYEGDPEEIQLYRAMYHFANNHDLSHAKNYNHIETLLDIESYVDYNIMFIYLNNRDWYGDKHFRFWRARETGDAPFHDGKWRVAVWDFDMSMNHHYVHFDMLTNAIHPHGGGNPPYIFHDASRTALLRNLLENDRFTHYFINRFADHINTTFRSERIVEVVNEEFEKIESLLSEHFDRWGMPVASEATSSDIIAFGGERPANVRGHIMNAFGIDQQVDITLQLSNQHHGLIRINSIEVSPSTPGVTEHPYPWTGVYFKDIPVEVEAIAAPGYVFSHWEGLPDTTSALVSFIAQDDVELTAIFARYSGDVLVHYWHFNDLQGDEVITNPVLSNHSALTPARITYPGTGEGYMDRYTPGSAMNIYMQEEAGHAMRVRNPSHTRELFLEAPSNGFEGLTVSFAVHRSNNGPRQQELYYRIHPDSLWVRIGEAYTIETDYTIKTFNLSGIEAVNNNPDLQFRVLFLGDGIDGSSGNNRFDNIAITGQYVSMEQFIITATAGHNGSITPSGDVVVEHVQSQTFAMVPDPGYMISDVVVDGQSQGTPAHYQFENLVSNHTIHVTFTEDDTAGGDIPLSHNVRVYPNPASSHVYIDLDEGGASVRKPGYTLYDLSNRVVMSGALKAGTNAIDISGLSQGVYLLMVMSHAQTEVFRIIRTIGY